MFDVGIQQIPRLYLVSGVRPSSGSQISIGIPHLGDGCAYDINEKLGISPERKREQKKRWFRNGQKWSRPSSAA